METIQPLRVRSTLAPDTDRAMKTLTLQLSDDTAQRLEVLAEKLGVSPEEIVQAGLAEQLSRLDNEYEQAADRVLQKNAELYRRLS